METAEEAADYYIDNLSDALDEDARDDVRQAFLAGWEARGL